MPPIEVKTAGYHHESLFAMLKLMWAPYAYGAKLWSMLDDAVGSPPGGTLTPWLTALRALYGGPEVPPPRGRRHDARSDGASSP